MEKLDGEAVQLQPDVAMLEIKPVGNSNEDNQSMESTLNLEINKASNVQEGSEEEKVESHVNEMVDAEMSSVEATPETMIRQDKVEIVSEKPDGAEETAKDGNKLECAVKQTVQVGELSSVSSISETERTIEIKKFDQPKAINELELVTSEMIDEEMLSSEADPKINDQIDTEIEKHIGATEYEIAKDCSTVFAALAEEIKIVEQTKPPAMIDIEMLSSAGNPEVNDKIETEVQKLVEVSESEIAKDSSKVFAALVEETAIEEPIEIKEVEQTKAAAMIDTETLSSETNPEGNDKIEAEVEKVIEATESEIAKDFSKVSAVLVEETTIEIEKVEQTKPPSIIDTEMLSREANPDNDKIENEVEKLIEVRESEIAKDNSKVSDNVIEDTTIIPKEEPKFITSSENDISTVPTISLNQTSPFLIQNTNNTTFSSLSLLAQYDSDSDVEITEDNMDVTGNNYRNQTIEIKSESSSDSSDSEEENLSDVEKEIAKRLSASFENCDEDDDYEGEEEHNTNAPRKKRTPPKVKGELLLEDLPPIQDLHITVPEEVCVELGKVHSIVDQLVLVNTKPKSLLLDLETVLFLNKGKSVLGEVFDVLGQVADPLYCVRFNSNEQIHEKGIKIGDTVYVAPETEHTQFVVLSSIMKMKGSDASWENDIEPPPRYLDYSDDEEERVARARLRNKKRAATGETVVVDDASDTESTIVQSQTNMPNIIRNPAFRRQRPSPTFNNRGGNFGQYRNNSNYPPRYPINNQANDSWHYYASRRANYRPHVPYHNHPADPAFNRNYPMPPMAPMAPMYNPYGGVMPPSQLQMPQNNMPGNLPPRGFPPQ